MKVLMLRNPGSHLGCDLRENDIGIVPDRLGYSLLAAGVAVEIEEPKPEPEPEPEPPIKTVSVAPEIAEAEEPVVPAVVHAVPEPPPIAEADAELITEEPQANAKPQSTERVRGKPKAAQPAKKLSVLKFQSPENKES